jgi:hypothetical protein
LEKLAGENLKMTRRIFAGVIIVLDLIVAVMPVQALELGVDVGAMYYTWEEHVSGGNVTESGYLPTIGGSIAGVPLKKYVPELRLDFDAKGFYGQVGYDTKTQSGIQVNTDSSYWGFKFGGNTGWRMMALDQSYVEPFIGLVYDLWVRDIENATFPTLVPPFAATASGYSELYQTLRGRVGLQTSVSLKVDSILGIRPKGVVDSIIKLSFSVDPMIWTREQVDFPGVGRVVIQNGRRLGWTIEGGMLWWHLEVKGYWQAIRFGASNVASGLLQPKSDQDRIGFQLGYKF